MVLRPTPGRKLERSWDAIRPRRIKAGWKDKNKEIEETSESETLEPRKSRKLTYLSFHTHRSTCQVRQGRCQKWRRGEVRSELIEKGLKDDGWLKVPNYPRPKHNCLTHLVPMLFSFQCLAPKPLFILTQSAIPSIKPESHLPWRSSWKQCTISLMIVPSNSLFAWSGSCFMTFWA